MPQLELRETGVDFSTLPLIQVGIEHGTEGLVGRFHQGLNGIDLKEAERGLVLDSAALGLEVHEGQRRTYEPYVNHLFRVAIRLIELGVADPVVLSAALLHDSPEDQSERLVRRFGGVEPPIADPHRLRRLGHDSLGVFARQHHIVSGAAELSSIVFDVSTPILSPGADTTQAYRTHVNPLLLHGDPRSSALKIADLHDNMEPPPDGVEDPEKRRRLDRKQIGIYPLIDEGLRRPDSIITGQARRRLLAEFAILQTGAIRRLGRE